MPYAIRDWNIERWYAREPEIGLGRRQDPPGSSNTETEIETETENQPTSTPTSPSSTPSPSSATASSPSPSPSPSLPVVSNTPTPTPTDPAGSSSLASQSSASTASTRSAVASLSSAGSSPIQTQILTSFITTNGAGQSVVTVSFTSNYAVPTTAPSRSGSNNTGAIVGGVVGGVGGLLVLAILLFFIRKKTRKDKFEENMFEPDRNIDRPLDLVEGDDVHDPEAIPRPYQLPPSPTRPEMAAAADTRPLSVYSGHSHGRPLSREYHDAVMMSRPTSGQSYYAPPNPGMGMPTPMPLSLDHIAHLQTRTNSMYDPHSSSQPTSEGMSDGGSSSGRPLKEREARRMHVANANDVVVHSDGGRVPDGNDDEPPREIPPTYESIGGPGPGPSGAR